MNPTTHSALSCTWPLAALAACAAGLGIRAILQRDDTHAALLSLQRAKRLFWGGRALGAGVILLAAGHLAGLLFPRAILSWDRAPARLLVLEGAAFALGLITLAAWTRATWRHLRRSDAWWPIEIAESLFLAMMFVAIASGLAMAVVHRWSSSWGIVTLRPYVLSLLARTPNGALVDHLPFLARAHLFGTFAAAAVFPATRLALFPVRGLRRLAALCVRPVATRVRAAGLALARQSAALLWSESHYRWTVKPVNPAAVNGAVRVRSLPPHVVDALAGNRPSGAGVGPGGDSK